MKLIKTLVSAFVFLGILSSLAWGQSLPADLSPEDSLTRYAREKPGEGEAPSLIAGSSYAFSPQSGVGLEDMSAGTTQLIGGSADNENSVVAPIGFLFRFDGAYYTTFGANANGLIKLGGATTTTNSVNSAGSVTNAPKIMPYWDDLCVGSSGKVHYKTTGPQHAHKLIIEWKNAKITRGGGCDGSGSGTFQLWLYERTGIVQFVYGSGIVAAAATNGGYTVGLQSDTATNFASVTTASGTVDYVNPNNTQMDAIAAGTSYSFTPNMPATPTGGSAAPAPTTVTLNWTDNATNETGYVVMRTTDQVNFYFVGFLAANSATFTDTGLEPSTQYSYYIDAISEGAFSDDLIVPVTTSAPTSVSSTASGGLWSSPATWSNGIVPGVNDNVTIASGATVIIDTAATAGSVTLGTTGSRALPKWLSPEGGSPARLTFEETAAHTLTVKHDISIGSNDVFATGGGSANQHVVSIGGSVINNGTLDLSTNNNQAGATLNFTGPDNATFGGTGAVTDVFLITMNKDSVNATVELGTVNFTVQGSIADSAGSGYLYLLGGTFKISGTFTGAYKTFPVAAYDIPATAGFWLNNPNYTVTAQSGSGIIRGAFRMSAGTLNAGTAAGQGFSVNGLSAIVEGGKINSTGFLGFGADNLIISGGTMTACTIGPVFNCTVGLSRQHIGTPVTLSGGEFVLQNSGHASFSFELSDLPNIRGTTLRFGNALTNGPGTYTTLGIMPNVIIDTSSGSAQSLISNEFATHVNNLNIGQGGAFQFPGLSIHGTTIVNNGVLKSTTSGHLEFDDLTGTTDITYTGTGTMVGIVQQMNIRAHSMTFDPAMGNLSTYHLRVTNAALHNINRVTVGKHDNTASRVEVFDGATFDTTPDYDLGPNGQQLFYRGTNTMGPEVNADRVLSALSFTGPGFLTLAGGDLATLSLQFASSAVILTGPHTLSAQLSLGPASPNGYVDGNLRMQFGAGHANNNFDFPVGQNGASPVRVRPVSIGANTALTIRAVDMTLPGLLPSVSASRYWTITEEGSIVAQLTFTPNPTDLNGNPANYKTYRSNGGPPVLVTDMNIDALTGDWGRGLADPGPVTVSGNVTTATGQPIRNATVTISGGGLPSPMVTATGNFGTFAFSGLQAGQTYTVQVSAKRYRFTPSSQVVSVNSNVTNVNFAANAEE
jgi:Carboxypeptidase regulatory-like domain